MTTQHERPRHIPHERDLEENLREAAELSLALTMLMAGITSKGYPHGIGEPHLLAISQLASKVHMRADAANRQWNEEEQS